MVKLKGKGVVLAGLVAGAVSFFKKKENRDKVKDYLNQAKDKVNQNHNGLQGMLDEVQKVVDENASDKSNNETATNSTQKKMDKGMDTNVDGVISDTIQKTMDQIMDDNAKGKMNEKDLTNTIQKTMDHLKGDSENKNKKNNESSLVGDLKETVEKVATTAATETESERKGNEMVDEGGAQQTLDVYNEIQENEHNSDKRQK